MLGFWLAAILFVLLLATIPVYPYNRTWGYLPVLLVLGRLLARALPRLNIVRFGTSRQLAYFMRAIWRPESGVRQDGARCAFSVFDVGVGGRLKALTPDSRAQYWSNRGSGQLLAQRDRTMPEKPATANKPSAQPRIVNA